MARTNGGLMGVAVPYAKVCSSTTTTFNSSGTLSANGAKLADVLVVAGGGGGGDNSGPAFGNGGGGGGGFRNLTNVAIPGSNIPVDLEVEVIHLLRVYQRLVGD